MRINTDQVARTLEKSLAPRLADRRRRDAADRRGGGRGARARARGGLHRARSVRHRPQLRLVGDPRREPDAVAVRRAAHPRDPHADAAAGQGGRRGARGARGRSRAGQPAAGRDDAAREGHLVERLAQGLREARRRSCRRWPVEIGRLPRGSRSARRGSASRFERGAAELLAERVEGNLLAAQQEIEKLALLHPAARARHRGRAGRGREQRALRRLPARRGGARGRRAALAQDPRGPARRGRRAAARPVGPVPGVARARGRAQRRREEGLRRDAGAPRGAGAGARRSAPRASRSSPGSRRPRASTAR